MEVAKLCIVTVKRMWKSEIAHFTMPMLCDKVCHNSHFFSHFVEDSKSMQQVVRKCVVDQRSWMEKKIQRSKGGNVLLWKGILELDPNG